MSREPFSSILIDPANPSQVQYWAKELGVESSDIKAAIVKVGRRLTSIRSYFGKSAEIVRLQDSQSDSQTKRPTWTAFHPVI
jgi:hypothetical protein